MHRSIPFLGAAFALLAAVPALAAAGLPKLSDLQAGPYSVALHSDSPTLVTGRNVLTLELPPGAGGRAVQLQLVGANGRTLPVQLRRVTVLGGGESGGHGSPGADTHAAAAAAAGNGSSGASGQGASGAGSHGSGDHGATPTRQPEPDPGGHASAGHAPAAEDEHASEPAGQAVLLRGAIDVPAAGAWTARLSLSDEAGETYVAEAALNAVDGGPNRLYLIVTGTLMAGAVLFGVVTRRLRPSGAVATTRRTQ